MQDRKDMAQEKLRTVAIVPGERYKHFKSGEYEVVTLATDEATLEPLVIYKNLQKGTVWARTLQNWNETVEVDGKTVKRFEKIE